MNHPTAQNPSNGTFMRRRTSWRRRPGRVGGRDGRVTGRAGWKTSGLAWAGTLIIEDMFRHAVLAWLAVAGPMAAAPVRAAADLAAGCPLPGKRR
jgi:hypothetical protein